MTPLPDPTLPDPASCTAVVLAGGRSRRFGSDKLTATVDGRPLLDRALDGLPPEMSVVVVGPERALGRPARFVREQPAGGGPAAGLVSGVRAALEAGADEVVVLPGDAPEAGRAAVALLEVLRVSSRPAVVGTDVTGFAQPLQLALRRSAAAQLVAAAGAEGAHGGSARALVDRLDPPALRHPLPGPAVYDIDTRQQLRVWSQRDSPAVDRVLAAVDAVGHGGPVVVALDGRTGTGKSTLAAALALRRPVAVVRGDDFYSPKFSAAAFAAAAAPTAPGPAGERDRLTGLLTGLGGAEVVDQVLDWRRLRAEALEPLRAGRTARFAPYDEVAGDGRLGAEVELAGAGLVVLEGVFSGRPELADLVDVSALLVLDDDVRRRRLLARGPELPAWEEIWERGEQHYFGSVRSPEDFDLVVSLDAQLASSSPGEPG